MTDLSTLTMWVAVLAVSSAVQVLLLVGGVIVALRTYRRTVTALTEFESRQIEPLKLRVNSAIDDVQDVIARVKSVDDRVRHVAAETSAAARQAMRGLSRLWPVLGVGRGVMAAVASLRHRDRSGSRSAAYPRDVPRPPRPASFER